MSSDFFGRFGCDSLTGMNSCTLTLHVLPTFNFSITHTCLIASLLSLCAIIPSSQSPYPVTLSPSHYPFPDPARHPPLLLTSSIFPPPSPCTHPIIPRQPTSPTTTPSPKPPPPPQAQTPHKSPLPQHPTSPPTSPPPSKTRSPP